MVIVELKVVYAIFIAQQCGESQISESALQPVERVAIRKRQLTPPRRQL